MASKRIARLNEQLRRELSELVRSSVRDPRVGIVTVTAVQVAPDLTTAHVHIRLQGDEAERRASLEGLRAAAPFLRRTLGGMLHIRRIPELRFREDTSLEHAQRIEAILAEVLPPGSGGPAGDAEDPGDTAESSGGGKDDEGDGSDGADRENDDA